MPETSAPVRLSRTARATATPTLETKSLYATDRGESRPLSTSLRPLVKPNGRRITVGQVEQLPHGTLRCFAEGGRVVVEVKDGRTRVGRALSVAAPPSLRVEGAELLEAVFSAEVDEFIGSPWHELEYVSLWTVHGLRTKGNGGTLRRAVSSRRRGRGSLG
ncbi:MAG: hypothetical protein JNJ54_23185 [Myxococcaceae bacterium]|nr:hypothetical protein [Myxococcaceae bacterium]